MHFELGRKLIRFAAACAAALVLTAAAAADPTTASASRTYPTSSESAALSPVAAAARQVSVPDEETAQSGQANLPKFAAVIASVMFAVFASFELAVTHRQFCLGTLVLTGIIAGTFFFYLLPHWAWSCAWCLICAIGLHIVLSRFRKQGAKQRRRHAPASL